MEVTTLAGLLREAEEHHAVYEATAPPHHWADFYAPYVVAREEGRTQADAAAEAGSRAAGARGSGNGVP
jgi:hypothetical protein